MQAKFSLKNTIKPPHEMSPRERRKYQQQVKRKADADRRRNESRRETRRRKQQQQQQFSLLDEMNSELEQQERQLTFPGFIDTDLEAIDQQLVERMQGKRAGKKNKQKNKQAGEELEKVEPEKVELAQAMVDAIDDLDDLNDPDDTDDLDEADSSSSSSSQKLDRIEWYEQERQAKLADPAFWIHFEQAVLTIKVQMLQGVIFPIVREKFKSEEIDAFWETMVGRVEFELLGGSALMQPNIEKAFAAIESFARDVRSMRHLDADSSIYELGLGPRLESQLEKAGIFSVEQLIECTEEQIGEIPNVGKDSRIRIKKRLAVFGLKLKRSLHEEMS
jgi:hypothetical protein